jgi:hypothetical protein
MSDERPMWLRQKGESPAQYAKFLVYRDLDRDDRSVLAAYNKIRTTAKKPKPPLEKVSGGFAVSTQKWAWRERAEAWDDAQQVKREQANEKAIREMNEKHARIAATWMGRVVKHLMDTQGSKAPMSDRLALEIMDRAANLERLALGEPTERIHRTGVGSGASVAVINRDHSHRILENADAARAADTIVAVLAGMESGQ